MLYAIVSDIHGNYNAWTAVLEDIQAIGVGRIVCLGDVVGYGPEPGRCVQSIRDVAHACVIGNHDAVVTKKLDSFAFNDHARKLIEWTELQLNPEEIDYLGQLDYEFSEDCFRCVHGDCDAPEEFNYIVDCSDAKLTWLKANEHIVFCGHSHLPAIFVTTKNYEEMCSLPAQDFTLEDNNRYIVNVGSVGSPRDDDLRASYVLFDSDTKSVFFRRVGYNFDDFRERVHFVGLNEEDVPLLCYVLESEPAEHITLEQEITKSEIVITNEASDLAKTVQLHQIDLSEILKTSSVTKFTNNNSRIGFGVSKKPIIIKKGNIVGQQNEDSSTYQAKTVLKHKPGVRANKLNSVSNINNGENQSSSSTKSVAPQKNKKKVNYFPVRKCIFILGLSLIMFLFIYLFAVNEDENNQNTILYTNNELEVYFDPDASPTENLLPTIWMSSSNYESLSPYRLTTENNVNVYFDNIDNMYGRELIFQNIGQSLVDICFESPYVPIDPKGKYLILSKVYFEEGNFDGDISMFIVNADDSDLQTATPSGKKIKFFKREISKKLLRTGDIPLCFRNRSSKDGWWLAQRTIEGKKLKQYMRVVIRGNFKGRISIGGISIQRID